MRTLGGEAAQIAVATAKVEVTNSAAAFVDLTTDVVSIEYDETTDEIVNAATIEFRRRDGGASTLAPLMVADPPLALFRQVKISVLVGAGYKEVFLGRIDAIDWKNRFGNVQVECRDQAGVIQDTWIETLREYGSAAGVALDTVMQDVADDNLASPPTIYFPVATSALVVTATGELPYGPPLEPTLAAERTLAESIGWTIRWRYIDSLTAWRWTAFEPERAKTTPDHTFGAADYYDVTEMNLNIEDIRNVVEVVYGDKADASGKRPSVKVTDATSITAYGRRYMRIEEPSDSPIRDSTTATALANAALSDLKEPEAILEITCPFFWPGEVAVDLYRFTANSVHFSSDQDLAPVAIRHRIAIGERSESKILCRGKPTGGVLMWRKRAQQPAVAEPDTVLKINGFREEAISSTTVKLVGTPGGRVDEVWIYDRTAQIPFTTEPWPTATEAADTVLSAATYLSDGYTATRPTDNNVRFLRARTKDANGNTGFDHDWRLYPTAPPPSITQVTQVSDGSIRYVDVICNSGTLSMKMEFGSWSHHVDGRAFRFIPSAVDPDGTAGVGAATWPMTLTAYSLPKVDTTGALTDTRAVSVTGDGGAAPPIWSTLTATAPADASADMTFTLKASSAPALHTVKVYARRNTGGAWNSYTDITADTSPVLTGAAPPTSNTTYTYTSAIVRAAGGPRTVTYEIKAEILDGSSAVVTTGTAQATWDW